MQQMIHKIRDKYTYCLLLLFVPLEVLPFLCEPDSTMGKALLLIKAALFGLLYILYADKQKWYIHVMLLITCVSMGVSVLNHGGAGIALLILTMFFALIAFPKIDVEKSRLQKVYLLLGIGAAIIILLCMISNYSKGLPAFSWRGKYNTNTIGILLLAAFFFFESTLHADESLLRITYVDLLLLICTLFLIYRSGCRSVLLSLCVFVICYLAMKQKKYTQCLYLLLVLCSILICFVAYVIQKNSNISNQLVGIEIFGKEILSGRERVWSQIFDGFIESPVFGKGIEYITETTGLESAHSVFMGVLLFGGMIPTIMYLLLLLSKQSVLSIDRVNVHNIQTQKIAFMACIVVAAFECIFTDNRLNTLFMGLLFCYERVTNYPVEITNEKGQADDTHIDVKENTECQKHMRLMCLTITCVLTLTFLLEPVAKMIVHEKLPMLMNQEYLDQIGYDANINDNVLGHKDYPSELIKGVAWEWNGKSYDVIGQTNTTTSFVNFYFSFDHLPEWAEPGKDYRVIYESKTVRLRICCYDNSGKEILTIETKNSLDFSIPIETVGLIVRISLEPNEPAYESVMPIIYPLASE